MLTHHRAMYSDCMAEFQLRIKMAWTTVSDCRSWPKHASAATKRLVTPDRSTNKTRAVPQVHNINSIRIIPHDTCQTGEWGICQTFYSSYCPPQSTRGSIQAS
ncbi:hypothetical protein I7I48_02399 [Histoplasma ohiense]|nr:hypothetical protein I7I48_02399 [Histoplasma ohiense (nom. inval.)]